MGGVLSILPLPFNVLLIVVLSVFSVVSLSRLRSRLNWIERSLEASVAAGVVLAAIVIPVKHLDRSVGPMHYDPMPLDQLTRALAKDWGVHISLDSLTSSERVMAFSTIEPMSRRQVLQKLARESGGELDIGYCGTGATFLFGAYPSFTRLKMAQPNGAANGSQPLRSETNRTSSAAGSRR
jgi:hypothetical protein